MTESRHIYIYTYKCVTNASKAAINVMPIHVTAWSGVRLRKIGIWNFGFESRRERIEVLEIFGAYHSSR